MKLTKNSFNSKLYRWFYCTNELPISLCPYFWKLLMAWVLLIPVVVITLPVTLGEIRSLKQSNYEKYNLSMRFGMSFLIYLIIFLVFVLLTPLSLFFTTVEYNSVLGSFVVGGVMGWVLIICCSIGWVYGKVRDHIRNKKRNAQWDNDGKRIIRGKRPNIIIEFIKAKYNRYCPKIEWIESDKTK